MHAPPLVLWSLAAVSAATALACLHRAWTGRTADRGLDAVEAAMGAGMAVMVLPVGAAAPRAVWYAAFGAIAMWCALQAVRPGAGASRSHHLHHAAGATAMVYMAAMPQHGGSAPGGGAMAGMDGMGAMDGAAAWTAPVTGALLLYFGAHALWTGARVMTMPAGAAITPLPGPAGAASGAGPGRPRPAEAAEAAEAVRAESDRTEAVRAGASEGDAPARRATVGDAVPAHHTGGPAAGCRAAMGVAMCAMLLAM